ncbi:MAG: 16S rRNA (cytidine(1402)-2'-O)-methyltransferase [Desulfobulbaceae bacterium]|uniref:Ribosomal RNA small subunit methyltransferase I n=1 Tax=Candidatus Desulfatifera sulfidica TaxID=2841691 RepID=A0A8J6NCK7_9BACT|nr:16S rRNA (cytidine(1402)-2'-O)-methyltransferase [Candidatus Desulfatifera sulfidica]
MTQAKHSTPGHLYIVPTPIGNLEDITLRALRILKEVDLIAAEDTRHSKRLLNHFAISTPLISYYREKEIQRAAELVERLLSGTTVALISDAGTPGISDPGAVLVREARAAGIEITPLPGPSALTTALSAAGFTDTSFLFLGFLPSKASQRRKLLTSLINAAQPIIFYESPHRMTDLLHDIHAIMGDRKIFWARELTKIHEELQTGTPAELLAHCTTGRVRGESVLIVDAGAQQPAEGENLHELLIWYRDQGELSLKDTSRRIAQDLGLSRSEVYQQALAVWKEDT